MRQWDPATSAKETNVNNLKDQQSVSCSVGRKRELFFVFGKFRNFFPILFSLNAIFFFFYANEREEFVDYLTY